MRIPDFQSLLGSHPDDAQPPGEHATWRAAAIKRGLLPIYSDWECCYALTAEAEPVYSADVTWPEILPLTNERHRFVVLALAAKEYPALETLRPQRRTGDPTCRTCKGTGTPTVHDNIICECGGLGWFPAGTELGPI